MNTNENNTEKNGFNEWALCEIMGHQRIIGKVSEQVIAGAAFLRVDVPDKEGNTRFTRFYGASSIYAISPISKEMAIQMAQRQDAEPVKRYEIPMLAEAVSPQPDDQDDDPDDGEERPSDPPY